MNGRWIILVLLGLALMPAEAEAQFFGGHSAYHWNYMVRHAQFSMAHTVMSDRVVFDDQGYIDLALTDLHPLAVRDLFPYPWLFRDAQLRELGHSPILFWSIPAYLPSYDELRRIYTLGGGYFFDPWFFFHGGYWDRAWAGMYGHFPYDTYWGYWHTTFWFSDYPHGGWWTSGHRAADHLEARAPVLSGQSVAATLIAQGKWKGLALTGDKALEDVLPEKRERETEMTRAYRDFLPGSGPDREGRRVIGDVTERSSSGGSLGTSRSGSKKKKTKKK